MKFNLPFISLSLVAENEPTFTVFSFHFFHLLIFVPPAVIFLFFERKKKSSFIIQWTNSLLRFFSPLLLSVTQLLFWNDKLDTEGRMLFLAMKRKKSRAVRRRNWKETYDMTIIIKNNQMKIIQIEREKTCSLYDMVKFNYKSAINAYVPYNSIYGGRNIILLYLGFLLKLAEKLRWFLFMRKRWNEAYLKISLGTNNIRIMN